MSVTFSQIGLQEVEMTFKFKVATYDTHIIRNKFSNMSDAVTQRLKDYVGQDGLVHCDICTMEFKNVPTE